MIRSRRLRIGISPCSWGVSYYAEEGAQGYYRSFSNQKNPTVLSGDVWPRQRLRVSLSGLHRELWSGVRR